MLSDRGEMSSPWLHVPPDGCGKILSVLDLIRTSGVSGTTLDFLFFPRSYLSLVVLPVGSVSLVVTDSTSPSRTSVRTFLHPRLTRRSPSKTF